MAEPLSDAPARPALPGAAALARLKERIDWSLYRPTRTKIYAICALLLAISIGVTIVQYSGARDLVLPAGPAIGGDYAAFYAASKAAAEGDAGSAYDPERFEAMLKQWGPPIERYGLTWQYPPTYFLAIAPLAHAGFLPGYILWTGLGAALFFAVMAMLRFDRMTLFVMLAAPSTFHAVITGQNGFLSAVLLTLAALYPDRRPFLAGAAAALLTLKPQLGLLLPVAYLAAGCWRAFFTAAAGALVLAGISIAAFGAAIWPAFLGGVLGVSGNLASGAMPLYKMATPFAAFRMTGLPPEAAAAVHIVFAFAAVGLVAHVWRRVNDRDLRAALLIACVFLTTPYGYFYELIILGPAVALLARRALQRGWLKGEQLAVSLIFILPLLLPGDGRRTGLCLGFVVVLTVLASVLRRLFHDYPQAFRTPFLRFASAGSPARPD